MTALKKKKLNKFLTIRMTEKNLKAFHRAARKAGKLPSEVLRELIDDFAASSVCVNLNQKELSNGN